MKLFVYGTLQPGEGLSGWLVNAYVGEPVRATTPGTLYHVRGGTDERPIYPVALIGHEEAVGGPLVHGTVLDLEDGHPDVTACLRMEEGAGYQQVGVLATLADGSVIPAVGFRYRHAPTGDPIVGGDWLRLRDLDDEDDEWDYDDDEPDERTYGDNPTALEASWRYAARGGRGADV